MNISKIFIQRPVMTTLVMIGLLIFGMMGYHSLPVSDLPNVDFPTIQVTANLPGANPETMASSVATPLEREFSTIAGLDSMTSSSTLGSAAITLQFSLTRDIDGAAADVQSAINAAIRQLPQDMPNPPSYKKVNPADAPILYITLTPSTISMSETDRYAENLLAERISTIPGVAQVTVYGAQKYAVRVQLNPDRMAAHDISFNDIEKAIQSGNVNLPTGSLNGDTQFFLIQSNGQLQNAEGYQKLIVAYRDGAPIRLQDLGQVVNGVENNKLASWYNQKRSITIAVQRQPGSNTIAVVDRIREILPQFTEMLPKGVALDIIYDRSESIRASVTEVKYTLITAALLVVLVIFLFLRNFRITFIPSIALPMSVIGTFAFMHQFNFSLNNLTLLALTLVVGFVIDDAIVMLENIVRHWEKGASPKIAALRGSKEIGFTILSMTISLIVVFIPILFMGGIMGRLFHEFAVTIILAILISGMVSLSLTPMLCSRLLPKTKTVDLSWMQWAHHALTRLFKYYESSLRWCLQYHRLIFGIFVLTFILTIGLYIIIPKGFLPSEDTGQLLAYTETDPSTSFHAMSLLQNSAADILLKNPNIAGVVSTVGSGGVSKSTNAGRLFVLLKPRAERQQNAEEIIYTLRPQLAAIPGIRIFLQNVPSIRVGGQMSKSPYQFTLQDSHTGVLSQWSDIFKNEIAKLPQVTDVTSDLQFTGPQIQVTIDRDKASTLGITAEQIQNTLYDAFGTRQISTIYTDADTYQVILELKPELQNSPSVLKKLYLRSDTGQLVPLTAVANITQGVGAQSINHLGQLPSVTISFALKANASLGAAVAAIQHLEEKLQKPNSLNMTFLGAAQAFKQSMQGFGWLVVIALIVVYIVLGILYESFIHPLTILSGLPSAGVGALVTLILFHNELNLYSFIGIIMLIGIVKKNAIMMIDFALHEKRKKKCSASEAIFNACTIRFRPIMMTTLAAIVGTLPIALAWGAGSETRRPLGLAVVGGLLVSQLLTLYITPVIYLYLEKLTYKNRRPLKSLDVDS